MVAFQEELDSKVTVGYNLHVKAHVYTVCKISALSGFSALSFYAGLVI